MRPKKSKLHELLFTEIAKYRTLRLASGVVHTTDYTRYIRRRDSAGPGSGGEEVIVQLDSDEFGVPEEEFRWYT